MGSDRINRCLLLLLAAVMLLPQVVRAEESSLKSGDRVVLVAEETAVALSSNKGKRGLSGMEIAPEAIDTCDDCAVWTMQQQDDGSWVLENAGGRLSMDSQTLSLTLDGAYDRWILTDLGEGLVSLVNQQEGWTLMWYSGHEVFEITQKQTEVSRLRLYILPEEDDGETTTETAAETTMETTTEATTETITETTTETTTESRDNPTQEPPSDPDRPDTGKWSLYFGQLHAHTADSIGTGTVEGAFSYAAGVPGMDFFAVTDYSDSFDNDTEGSLALDGSTVSRVWAKGKAAARAVTNENFVGIYGFEMRWSQGQGHIATFNTPGWISRDQEAYQNYRDGMENYFDALLAVPGSVSQFNHPGTDYGDFKAFDRYSPKIDALITLIEVGSGAGSEYQTAYDAYIQALDKGWHLAPTNNQNNREGYFGDADTGRTVVLAETLTEQSLYEAMKNRRVYATEDSDLHIYYTLDGAVMGSELPLSQVGDRAELVVKLFDPTDAEMGRVEVVGPGGDIAGSAAARSTVSFSLPSDGAYYFIRVTQPDGDVAVTAPVWIRQTDDIGISRLETAAELTRAGEEQTVRLEVYNNEAEVLRITSITLTDGDGTVLGTAGESQVSSLEAQTFSFPCTFETDGVQTLTATVRAVFSGEEREFTRSLLVQVLPVVLTSDVLVEGTHGQGGTFTEFIDLAAEKQISVRVEQEAITPVQLISCRLLVIPAPETAFEPEFLETVKSYVNSGGKLLLLGKAGGSAELNRLLEAIGSDLRLNGDVARDEVNNGGQPDQIYTAAIRESDWTAGVMEGQTFAHVGGCTLEGGDWLVKSAAGDVLLAEQECVILSGSNFLADDFLVQPESRWTLSYANRTIAENLLGIPRTPPEVAPIGMVRLGEEGRIYLVEGLVTAGTHNVNNDFPDTIYVQDDSGAITAVGYSEQGLELGRRVKTIGCLTFSDDRPVLEILQIELLDKETPIIPESVGNALDYSSQGDQLLKIEGTVTQVDIRDDIVRSFLLKDGSGQEAKVWAEDYIFSGSLGWNHLSRFVKVGNRVSAVGLCHLLEGKPVLRLRDCDEVVLLWEPPEPTTGPAAEPTETSAPAYPDNPPTGDRVVPSKLLAAMAVSSLLLGFVVKKKT